MNDPKMRADGTCAREGCSKPLPELALAEGDPFHSSLCCRKYHDVVFACDAKSNVKED